MSLMIIVKIDPQYAGVKVYQLIDAILHLQSLPDIQTYWPT